MPAKITLPALRLSPVELYIEVNRLLVRAKELKGEVEFGAVNWSHLHLVDISYEISMLNPENGPSCRVRIEEASPECAMAGWLYDQIDHTRFPGVFFECAW